MRRNKRDNCVIKQWRIRGRGLGARAPLNFRPNRKNVFGDRPRLSKGLDDRPPAYLRVWMTGPAPRPTLSQGMDPAL